MSTWVTSDLHFNHKLMSEMRGFNTVDEMGNTLIANWNSVIKPDDRVYMLGDFAFGNKIKVFSYFTHLNGAITVLCNPWHHDKYFSLDRNNERFQVFSKSDYTVLFAQPIVVLGAGYKRDGYEVPIVLSHYPQYIWDRKHYLSFHLYGHVHHKEFEIPNSPLSFNVGMDTNSLYPCLLAEITEILENRIDRLNLKSINEDGDE